MISVIIPVYNAADYLDRCLESVSVQSFSDWECILVNDGSTDSSGAICDGWCIRDERFKSIHQSNRGVSTARNNGILASSGDYLCFIDADDWVEADYLESMIGHAADADLVVSGQTRERAGEQPVIFAPSETGFFYLDPEHSGTFIDLCDKFLLFAPHEKLYKKGIVVQNGLHFPADCSYGEDLVFNFYYLRHTQNVYTIANAPYHYSIGEDTLSTVFRPDRFKEDYGQWKILDGFCREKGFYDSIAINYLYKRLWGIVYDGVFAFKKLDGKGPAYFDVIFSIPELTLLKKYRRLFDCSAWIKAWILGRRKMLFYLYFKLSR